MFSLFLQIPEGRNIQHKINIATVIQIATGPDVQDLKNKAKSLKYILPDKLKHSIKNEIMTYFPTSLVIALSLLIFASVVITQLTKCHSYW